MRWLDVGRAITEALQEDRDCDLVRQQLADTFARIDEAARSITAPRPPVKVINLQIERVGDIQTGAWCDHCNLPSAVIVPLALVHSRTLKVLRRSDLAACHDCGCIWTHTTYPTGGSPT